MNKYSIGDILKRNEVGDYGEMWLEITSIGGASCRGVLRNKDWEIIYICLMSAQTLDEEYTPAPDEIKVGDVLERDREPVITILARIGKVFNISLIANDRIRSGGWYTKEELDYVGYKKTNSTTPLTLTQEEARKILEEKLGEKIIIK